MKVCEHTKFDFFFLVGYLAKMSLHTCKSGTGALGEKGFQMKEANFRTNSYCQPSSP